MVKPTSHASADALMDSLRRQLRASGYQALHQISCEYCDGAVLLHGRVPSFFLKQMAQTVLLSDCRVGMVVNLLEVLAPADSFREESVQLHHTPVAEA